jgi:hypothetical protein
LVGTFVGTLVGALVGATVLNATSVSIPSFFAVPVLQLWTMTSRAVGVLHVAVSVSESAVHVLVTKEFEFGLVHSPNCAFTPRDLESPGTKGALVNWVACGVEGTPKVVSAPTLCGVPGLQT